MTQFKVGDRVRVRGTQWRGTVVEPTSSCPRVQLDSKDDPINPINYHPELLIKLKPRVKREKHVFVCEWGKTCMSREIIPGVFYKGTNPNSDFRHFFGQLTRITVEVLDEKEKG